MEKVKKTFKEPKIKDRRIVHFRMGKDNIVIGNLGRKICLIVETISTNHTPRPNELWLCSIINVFPNVIDICPLKHLSNTKTEEPLVRKKRSRTSNIIIEKVER